MNDIVVQNPPLVNKVYKQFDELRTRMESFGIHLPDGFDITAGRFQHFPTNSDVADAAGWLKVFPDGKGACFGDFRRGLSESWSAAKRLTADAKSGFAAAKTIALEEAAVSARAYDAERTAAALSLWSSAVECDNHEYLTAKNIRPLGGVRSAKGMLLVPAYSADGRLVSVERIFYVAENGVRRRIRRHLGPKAGARLVLGDLSEADVVLLCEGFATGVSLAEATGRVVVVTFSSSNLATVAAELRRSHPLARLLICGDDDSTVDGNPGRTAAEAAARKVDGFTVFPVFPSTPEPGNNDFNALAAVSIDAVREQVETAIEAMDDVASPAHQRFLELGIQPLGLRGGNPVIAKSHRSRGRIISTEILTIKSRKDSLATLAASADLASIAADEAGRPDWDRVFDCLRNACESQGVFHIAEERGAGVWRDEKGRPFLHDGTQCFRRGSAFYVPDYHGFRMPAAAWSAADMRTGANALYTAIEASFGAYAAAMITGWSVAGFLGGALPWRPHLWVTAPADTGKTTLARAMERILGDACRANDGSIGTEAGSRGSIENSACAIVLDETEAGHDAVRGLIALARSSAQGRTATKGTADLGKRQFMLMSPMYFSSISSLPLADADATRIMNVELVPTGVAPAGVFYDDALLDALGGNILAGILEDWPALSSAIEQAHGDVVKLADGKWRMQNTIGTLIGLARWVTGRKDITADFASLKDAFVAKDSSVTLAALAELPVTPILTVRHVIEDVLNDRIDPSTEEGREYVRAMETKTGLVIVMTRGAKHPSEFELVIPTASITLAKALAVPNGSWTAAMRGLPNAQVNKPFQSEAGTRKGTKVPLWAVAGTLNMDAATTPF